MPRVNSEVVQTVFESLRLDQVVYLEVTDLSSDFCNEEVWSLIGDLPQLEKLQVYQCRTRPMVEALCRQVQPKNGTPSQATTHLAFPALAVLEITGCNFYDQDASDMGELFDCIELRREEKLPLKRLRIVNCHGVEHFYLNNLRQIIDQVIWDGSGAVENERGHWDVEGYMDFSDYD
ncbi:hypothetical protein H0H92_000470 [Tricholoma furcatifolium]|nr:hypothetical protein H0H92_000470 [Tricholoma furcatifolium]